MKLRGLRGKGPNRSRRNARPKARLENEQLMEEVCGRENCQQALRRVKANKGSPGIDGMKVDGATGLPEAALARDSGTAAERNVSSRNR